MVLGLLFGPPIAGMVHGVRSDGPGATDYVLAGGVSLGLVAFWVLGASTLGALFGDLLYLPAIAASVVVPATHVYRRHVREGSGVLGLGAVYTPPLLLVVAGAWVGL